MSRSYESRSRRSRSPGDDYAKRSILSKVDKSELTAWKVSIKKSGVIATAPNLPLERSIDDPAKICPYVHVRKDVPPRVPVFGRDIKVDQDFRENRTVFQYESAEKTSRRRSRSKRRSVTKDNRHRSRSWDRGRRSKSRSRERWRSRSKDKRSRRSSSSTRRDRSRSREFHYSKERRKRRDISQERSRKSRTRSVSPRSISRHRPRSITPLRPGEYRPGHPDLALRGERRNNRRSQSRSVSPRSIDEKSESSRSRERRSPADRYKSGRTQSPYRTDSVRSRSRRRSPPPTPIYMPGMEYGYFEGYAPIPMQPYRARFPTMNPNFYPRMLYPHGMMMPRIPMMHPRMPIRPRLPVYNQGIKPAAPKPATLTSGQQAEAVAIEDTSNVSSETIEGVTSTERQEEESVSDEIKS